MASRVSVVALPRCGSSTTFSSADNPGCSAGSPSYTSSPAPATWPAQRGDQRRHRPPVFRVRHSPPRRRAAAWRSARRSAIPGGRPPGALQRQHVAGGQERGIGVMPAAPRSSAPAAGGRGAVVHVHAEARGHAGESRPMRPMPKMPSRLPLTCVPSSWVGASPSSGRRAAAARPRRRGGAAARISRNGTPRSPPTAHPAC